MERLFCNHPPDTKPHAVLVETLFISSNDVYLIDTATEQQKMVNLLLLELLMLWG